MNTNKKGEIEMEKINYKGDVALFTTTHIKPRRLDIYWIDLGKGNGSIQGGLRPCVVTTNDMANKFSPVIQIAPITSSMTKKKLPTHVNVKQGEAGLSKDSTILLEQNMPVNKTQIRSYIGTITDREVARQINQAIKIQMGVC